MCSSSMDLMAFEGPARTLENVAREKLNKGGSNPMYYAT